jgi:tripartite-type tricarboxylate transporter receptor subunit TctC
MMSALLGGEVTFAFASLPTIVAHVKNGTLRILAVTGEHRAAAFPESPTIAEFLPGYRVLLWYGLLAPAGTPQGVVAKLDEAVVKVLNDPKVIERLTRLDIEATPTTTQAFAAQIAADLARYRTLIEKAGIHVE